MEQTRNALKGWLPFDFQHVSAFPSRYGNARIRETCWVSKWTIEDAPARKNVSGNYLIRSKALTAYTFKHKHSEHIREQQYVFDVACMSLFGGIRELVFAGKKNSLTIFPLLVDLLRFLVFESNSGSRNKMLTYDDGFYCHTMSDRERDPFANFSDCLPLKFNWELWHLITCNPSKRS